MAILSLIPLAHTVPFTGKLSLTKQDTSRWHSMLISSLLYPHTPRTIFWELRNNNPFLTWSLLFRQSTISQAIIISFTCLFIWQITTLDPVQGHWVTWGPHCLCSYTVRAAWRELRQGASLTHIIGRAWGTCKRNTRRKKALLHFSCNSSS